MDMKSNSQAMETEKIPRLLAQLAIPAVEIGRAHV